jgi:hypothetical protein
VDDLAMVSRAALWLSVSSNGAAGWFMSHCTTTLKPIARHYTSKALYDLRPGGKGKDGCFGTSGETAAVDVMVLRTMAPLARTGHGGHLLR